MRLGVPERQVTHGPLFARFLVVTDGHGKKMADRYLSSGCFCHFQYAGGSCEPANCSSCIVKHCVADLYTFFVVDEPYQPRRGGVSPKGLNMQSKVPHFFYELDMELGASFDTLPTFKETPFRHHIK
jgi:hypothetical protein